MDGISSFHVKQPIQPPNNKKAVPTVSAINFENPSMAVSLNPKRWKKNKIDEGEIDEGTAQIMRIGEKKSE